MALCTSGGGRGAGGGGGARHRVNVAVFERVVQWAFLRKVGAANSVVHQSLSVHTHIQNHLPPSH